LLGKSRLAIFREQIRIAGFAIVAFGVLLTIASLFADPLALGMPGTGFGWKQILGTFLGLAIAGLGWLVLYRTAQADAADKKAKEGGDEDV
jgi:hypothetical protein